MHASFRFTLPALLSLGLAFTTPLPAASGDADFAMKAAAGGLSEVQMGALAVNKGQSRAVRDFGQRMVDDHRKANGELEAIAGRKDIRLPKQPEQAQQVGTHQLHDLPDEAFDEAYGQMAVKHHMETIDLFRKEVESGTDAELKAFAQKTLPTLEEHLRLAQQLPGADKANPALGNRATREREDASWRQRNRDVKEPGTHGGH